MTLTNVTPPDMLAELREDNLQLAALLARKPTGLRRAWRRGQGSLLETWIDEVASRTGNVGS